MRPLFIITCLLLVSCQKDIFSPEEELPTTNQLVDYRLQTFFDLFEQEAARHGLYLDLEDMGITGVIEEIYEQGVAGTCQYGRHIAHVTLDLNFWNNSGYYGREMVVFHELGHCVLNRGHYEAEFSNGVCKSIMNSGTSGCQWAYNSQNREYYLGELFDVISNLNSEQERVSSVN